MSVLIKDMEVPKNCNVCNFHMLRFCCAAEKDLAEKDTRPLIERRPEWCPLVPVPPHGRLGDLDALAGQFTPDDLYYPTEEDRRDYDNHSISMRDVREAIEMAPTIIPADQI